MPDLGEGSLEGARIGAANAVGHAHAIALLHGLTSGLLSVDAAGRVCFVNEAACDILGLPEHPLPGVALQALLGQSAALDRAATEAMVGAAASATHARGPAPLVLAIGDPARSITVSASRLPDGIAVLRIERGGDHGAGHSPFPAQQQDALTGLADREGFRELLGERLQRFAEGDASPVAVLAVQLDRFKRVNETLGRRTGDEVLRLVARRLGSVLGPTDIAARFGGDEFAILLDRGAPDASDEVARLLLEIVTRPYLAGGHMVSVGASIGIARAPDHAVGPVRLLGCAELAAGRAKASGGQGYAMFEPDMDAQAQARHAMEIDLRRALKLGQLEVHYQPQVSLGRRSLSGFEALARWRHPQLGMISPEAFIPLAEEIGLIAALGEWVLLSACREAASWPADLTLAVNVSARQFEDGRLVDVVRGALAASRLPATRLELEITESVLMRDEAAAIGMLHELRRLGVRVAMDDFGTGYSSLSQLRSFPFDKIKIDRSFVRNLAADGSNAMIRAIAAMGASLGMSTIAEGVETEDELARMRIEGCDAVQGYVFSRPVPAADLPALIARLRNPAAATRQDPQGEQ